MSSRTTKGNIFRDLHKSKDNAENLIIRSKLLMALQKVIRESHLSQEKIGEWLGIQQPRVSNLMTGRIDQFSIDTLINMAVRAGLSVNIEISQPKAVAQTRQSFAPTESRPDLGSVPLDKLRSKGFKQMMERMRAMANSATSSNPTELSPLYVSSQGTIQHHGQEEFFTLEEG